MSEQPVESLEDAYYDLVADWAAEEQAKPTPRLAEATVKPEQEEAA